jgi:hypothetical protein
MVATSIQVLAFFPHDGPAGPTRTTASSHGGLMNAMDATRRKLASEESVIISLLALARGQISSKPNHDRSSDRSLPAAECGG